MAFDTKYFKEICRDAGIELSDGDPYAFSRYYDMIIEKNRVMNLTRVTEPQDVAVKHFLDSLMLCKCGLEADEKTTICDVGSGAGLPGICLAIYTRAAVTMVDSLGKRVNFLSEVIDALGLKGSAALHYRAEEYGVKNRECFDIVTARAVAAMPELCEYCLPLCKVGGVFYAMKGPNAEEETNSAKKAIEILGGKIKRTEKFTLPGDNSRTVIAVEKISPTPRSYPRQSQKITKFPL